MDFTGQRAGVIGTGASAVQAIPLIAKEASDLTVFQRTANYIIPAELAACDAGTSARRETGEVLATTLTGPGGS